MGDENTLTYALYSIPVEKVNYFCKYQITKWYVQISSLYDC